MDTIKRLVIGTLKELGKWLLIISAATLLSLLMFYVGIKTQ